MEDIIENKIDLLFAITESITGISRETIVSKNRKQHIAIVRNVVGCILHNELGLTVIKSGKLIGKDHSTIVYYAKVFEANMSYFKNFSSIYESISETFWGNYSVADTCDVDLQIKSLQNLINELEFKKRILIKNY
jgi:chromosomal replication initiation ATPase DnaA